MGERVTSENGKIYLDEVTVTELPEREPDSPEAAKIPIRLSKLSEESIIRPVAADLAQLECFSSAVNSKQSPQPVVMVKVARQNCIWVIWKNVRGCG